tara:strand:- start:48389 stop:50218 length:1830 start_codon:yes stop_codon:yes gene_type:complete
MIVVFESVNSYSYLLIILLRILNIKVYYFRLFGKNEKKRIYLAEKLKSHDVFPLPIQDLEKISEKNINILEYDNDEIIFKHNKFMVSDKILTGFRRLYSSNKISDDELRLAIQDIIFSRISFFYVSMKIWSEEHKNKRVLLISFNFWTFYFPKNIRNLTKFIIPLNFLKFFKKLIFNKNVVSPNKSSNKNDKLNASFDREVAILNHHGLINGENLYDKTLYYSKSSESPFYPKNIVHINYTNLDNPSKDLIWLNLNKVKISKKKIIKKIFLNIIKTFHFITSWKNFLAWFVLFFQYLSFLKFSEKINIFKNLKLVIIDYDHLCPKGLLLALKKKEVKLLATQERFIGGLFTSFYNVIADVYLTGSDHVNKVIEKSKYFQVKKVIPVGQYRVDYLSQYQNRDVPREILDNKEKGKKIIIILGTLVSEDHWFDTSILSLRNWKSLKVFLQDSAKLASNIKEGFFILRFKNIKWSRLPYFQDTLKQLEKIDNLIIADDYSRLHNSYRYCANADLIIANFTSLADESLAYGKSLLFYDYSHNFNKTVSGISGYLNDYIFCHSYQELIDKTKKFLSKDFSNKDIEELHKIQKIYSVENKKKIKDKVIEIIEKEI